MSATVLGIVKNNEDFRSILTGNFLYAPKKKVYVEGISVSNNNAYLGLDRLTKYMKFLTKISPQWSLRDAPINAGVFTMRGWGQIYYRDGTNRRAVKGAFNSFLCTDIEQWRDKTVEGSWIRRDITRTPGGEGKVFQNRCKSCHAPMDAMAGAFAYLDFGTTTLRFSRDVNPKYLKNADVFPDGYITLDTSWVNMATKKHNKKFGWDETLLEGNGLADFANMIAKSEGFNKCMSIRVIESICSEKRDYEDSWVQEISSHFKATNFNLKKIFKKVFLDDKCKK
jgi:hypothetical protein